MFDIQRGTSSRLVLCRQRERMFAGLHLAPADGPNSGGTIRA
jgi:hypothetical protein